MKSALRRLRNQGSPVPLTSPQRFDSLLMNTTAADAERLMLSSAAMGTVYSIVSLYAESAARPDWKLFRKQPRDARVRYTTTDEGSDQRVEVVRHAALDLINNPNPFYTRFTLFELDQMYLDLTGEWYWVLERHPMATFPVGAWPVRPDRIEPVPHPTRYIAGYVYTSPDGREKIPLATDDVIGGKYPNPLDPMHGLGPVQSVLVDIDSSRYSAAWNRNFFINSATPGGVITMDGSLDDTEWDEFQNRWRETHQGTQAAHRVAMLENGAKWVPNAVTQKDMDFVQLRGQARDIVREAFRAPKVMLGVSDDVNRANAQTGQEVFDAWTVVTRLDRKRDALNHVLLPMFGSAGVDVEFDYVHPAPANRELDQLELTSKSAAVQTLIAAGFDPGDVLEVVGLPAMGVAPKPEPVPASALPGTTAPGSAGAPMPPAGDDMQNRLRRMLANGHLPIPAGRP